MPRAGGFRPPATSWDRVAVWGFSGCRVGWVRLDHYRTTPRVVLLGRLLACDTGAVSRANLDAATELRILELAAEGLSSRQISKRVGVPRSTVKRRIEAARVAEAELEAFTAGGKGGDDGDRDPWDDESDDPWADAARLELLAAQQQPAPREVAEPITYVGKDSGGKRWRDANNRSLNELGWYRFRSYVRYGLDDHDRADLIDAAMDAQIEEYNRVHGISVEEVQPLHSYTPLSYRGIGPPPMRSPFSP